MVGTVTSARQPAASAASPRASGERAAVSRPQAADQPQRAAAQERNTPQARSTPQNDSRHARRERRARLEAAGSSTRSPVQLDRRGAARGSRARQNLTAENVDARITNMARELRARAQDRTGYGPPATARTGMVVNRAV